MLTKIVFAEVDNKESSSYTREKQVRLYVFTVS